MLKTALADYRGAFSFCIEYNRLSSDAITSDVNRDALTACCALVSLERARMARDLFVLPPRVAERTAFGCIKYCRRLSTLSQSMMISVSTT